MPRAFDTSEITSGTSRTFLPSRFWEETPTAKFYFSGYEKITKVSKKGNEYTAYFIYLIDLAGEPTEYTLEVIASKAQALKEINPEPYQFLEITKSIGDDGWDEWTFVKEDKFMPEKDRPQPLEYGEYKQKEVAPKKVEPTQEVNIDDIPF